MDAVAAALATHPRTGFLPPRHRRRAGYDGPLEIGAGQTNSQPRTVEAMLRLLDVRPGHRVLDVGAGSGWTTALLACLTGPGGSVRGVELEPELVGFGSANLAATRQPWATITRAEPGVLGLPSHAPYDRILVSAQPRELPAELVDQLASPRDSGALHPASPPHSPSPGPSIVRDDAPQDGPVGGRMVIPVAGTMLLVVRTGPGAGEVEVSRHGAYRFVPLR